MKHICKISCTYSVTSPTGCTGLNMLLWVRHCFRLHLSANCRQQNSANVSRRQSVTVSLDGKGEHLYNNNNNIKQNVQNQQLQTRGRKIPFVADPSLVDAFVYRNPPIRERQSAPIMAEHSLSGPPLFVASTNEMRAAVRFGESVWVASRSAFIPNDLIMWGIKEAGFCFQHEVGISGEIDTEEPSRVLTGRGMHRGGTFFPDWE